MNKLLNIISELKENPLIKENENYIEEVISIQKRLEDKSFKLAVVGEFSSGKSTFINALIGKDLLKHATLETTATVTYIHNIDSKDKTKIKVNYINGETKEYLDYKYIQDATTTASQEDVARNIEYVDIYTQFVNASNDLTIVDTPGLNGVADNHREKTIEEIKKSHACIYVLQKNGISDSDREFIRFLFSYQNNFIFVQNFIDELKESEGEYLSKKLDFLKSDIERIIQNENIKIDYNIVGVSALKGLVGKDKTISKLYENDIFDLTDKKRQDYLKESNISEVEDLIKVFVKRKNNIKSKKSLTYASLEEFLKRVIYKENMIVELNNEHMKNDIYFKDKELADERILYLTDKEGKISEKLKDAVSSQFKNHKKLIKEDINNKLNEIEIKINEIISKENDYESFDKKCKNQYFTNELQKIIDNYKDKIEEYEYYSIQDIYKTMLARLNKYTSYTSKEVKSLDNINLVEVGVEQVDLTFNDKKQDIDILRNQLSDNQSIKLISEDNIPKIKDNIKNINYNYNILEQKKEKLRNDKIYEEQRLGTRPKQDIEYDYIEVEIQPQNTWQKIKNIFTGPKTETKRIPRYNDKKGIAWDRKKRELDIKYQRDIENINKELDYLKSQQIELNSKLDTNNMNFENSNRMIKYLDMQIKVKTEELEQYETNAKKEYLEKRKKEIKEGIKSYLYYSNDNSKSIKDIFIEKVDYDFIENKKIMEAEILKQYQIYVKNEIERLELIKSNSVEKLNKKYNDNLNYLNQIKVIYQNIGGDNYESAQTGI